jgi:hypothetical protein
VNKKDRAKLLPIANDIAVVQMALASLRNGETTGMTNRDAIEQCELMLIRTEQTLMAMVLESPIRPNS